MTAHNGFRAVWSGREFDASPDGDLVRLYAGTPEPGFEPVGPQRYRRLVLAAEVGWLGYVRTTARWGARTVIVLAVADGRALIEYQADAGWEPGRGPEPGVWRSWVGEPELTERHELRWPAG